ncbi:MAG TPA: DUF4189 domain-containing protein [Burkholderiales bacterium]
MRAFLAALALATFACTAAAASKAPKKHALHGAIAYEKASGSVGWATDRPSSREAQAEALAQCARDACVVVVTVSRACAALATSPKKFAAQKGATQKEAETKALGRCGAGCQVAAWVCAR